MPDKSTVGDPIWVESCMNNIEHKECHKKYPSTILYSKQTKYDPTYHKGGKWRDGMGAYLSARQIAITNENIDYLIENYVIKET